MQFCSPRRVTDRFPQLVEEETLKETGFDFRSDKQSGSKLKLLIKNVLPDPTGAKCGWVNILVSLDKD